LVRPGADSEGARGSACESAETGRKQGWTGHPVRNAWGECGFPRAGRSSRWGPPSCPECAGSGTAPVGACMRDYCSTVYLRRSEIKGGHRKERIRRTHVRRCHPRSGGEAPGAGKVPLSSARLIGCAPEAVGDAWLIPTRARRRATRPPLQRCARRRARDERADQQSVSPTPTPSPITTPISADRSGRRGCRRRAARSSRAGAASRSDSPRRRSHALMPLAARLRPGHRAAAVTVGSHSAASRWGTCHASTEADWSPIKRCRT